ncbi:LysE family translocator, partial [Stutzerimonas kunmingensis]
MSQLLPFVLFAFVASITPGPTNILVLSNSSRFGLGAAMPIIFGACSAAALIVLLVGLGAGEWLLHHPQLQQLMSWLGLAWLLYLAWQIARSPAGPVEAAAAPRR